jgi:hypothetical protein
MSTMNLTLTLSQYAELHVDLWQIACLILMRMLHVRQGRDRDKNLASPYRGTQNE